ncbi:MAG: MFS transporter [Leptospiraceae bacterium]|nr:MFS transporter [Leptospiraceae bacterium]
MAGFTAAQWRILIILAALQFLHIMDFMLVMPLAKKLELRFQITTNEFGWLVSGYALSAFTAGIVGSLFIDRMPRGYALASGVIGFIAANFLCATAQSFAGFLAARMLTGAFGGMINGLIFAVTGDITQPEQRGRASGIIMVAFSLAAVIGVPSGIWLAGHFFLQLPFYVIALCSLLLLLGILTQLPRLDAHRLSATATKNPVRRVLAEPRHRRLYLLVVFHFVAGFSIIPYIAGFMQKNNGVSDDQLFWIYAVGGAATVFTSPLIGTLTDKFGAVRMYTILSLIAIAPFLLVTHECTKYFPLLLLLSILFFVFVSGRMVPAMALLNNLVNPAVRGTFMSLNTSVQQLAMAAGSFLASLILVAAPGEPIRNYAWVGWFGVAANCLAIAVANTLKNSQKP